MDRRTYAALHTLDTHRTQAINALVTWNGKDWTVTIDDVVLQDCCDTIEQAFTAAEREIARLVPHHTCVGCRQWEPRGEA